MSKREERLSSSQEEAELIRRQAEAEVLLSKWDLDPPKQFIRRYAWLDIIRDYNERVRRAGIRRPLKYLTLPGMNASDIGHWWKEGLLSRDDQGRLNVAICDDENAEQVASNLGTLGGVLDYGSRTLIQELTDPSSRLVRHFPFDVINLDMCDCLIPLNKQRGLDTVRWLLRHQRGQGFLLLLTTKPDPNARDKYLRILRLNLQNESGFRQAYVEEYGTDDERPCLINYTNFSQIVFPKAIASLARSNGYKTRERFAAWYPRNDEGSGTQYDMVCHSLEFEPIGCIKPASKYKPRFREVNRNENDEVIFNELSSTVREKAEKQYGQFVMTLPLRKPEDVKARLSIDASLEADLDKEARSLMFWWRSTVEETVNK